MFSESNRTAQEIVKLRELLRFKQEVCDFCPKCGGTGSVGEKPHPNYPCQTVPILCECQLALQDLKAQLFPNSKNSKPVD